MTGAVEVILFVHSFAATLWYARPLLFFGERCDDPPLPVGLHWYLLLRQAMVFSAAGSVRCIDLSFMVISAPGHCRARPEYPTDTRISVTHCLADLRGVGPLSLATCPGACPGTGCTYSSLPVALCTGRETL